MYIYYIIAIITALLLITAGVIYYFIHKKPPTPITPSHIMQQEVFLVKVIGAENLGQGMLNLPYIYATNEMINSAIKDGLRNYDVKQGDYILYQSDQANKLPYSSPVQNDYFKSSDSINLSPVTPQTKQVTYWAAIYGYKPLPKTPWWNIFTYSKGGFSVGQNSKFVNIAPFNTDTYYSPQKRDAVDSQGKEVFWLLLDRNFSPPNTQQANQILQNGFQLASLDQYKFSFSKGLGINYVQLVNADAGNNAVIRLSSILDKAGPNSGLRPCLSSVCEKFNKTYPRTVFAVWGDKNIALKKGVGYISTIAGEIIPFNKNKSSQYF